MIEITITKCQHTECHNGNEQNTTRIRISQQHLVFALWRQYFLKSLYILCFVCLTSSCVIFPLESVVPII